MGRVDIPQGEGHIQQLLLLELFPPCRTKWAKVDGILYKPECAIVLEVIDDYPVFGQIQSIFVVDCVVFLHVCVIRTVSFNNHIHVYIVKRTPTLKTLPVRSLY